MKVFTLYLVRSVVTTTLIVVAVLLALAGFFEFIAQLDDTSVGRYDTWDAAVYTLLRLPLLAVQMLPVATLLGAMLGLGTLASHSELVVMRASGVSHYRLAGSVAVAGALIMLGTVVLGEYLAPPLDQFARKYRSVAKNEEAGLTGGRSTWVRDGSTIFNVERISSEFEFGGVYLFELGPDRRLASISHADNAGLDAKERWVFENFARTRFTDEGATASRQPRTVEDYGVDAEVLGIAVVKPGSLSVRGLLSFIGYLKKNELDATTYQTELWNRIASTLTITLMPVLAIGFVFGSLRSAGAGGRLMVGVLIGLAYFLASRMLANTGVVFNLNPAVLAWLPTVALLAVTAFVLSRVR